MGRWKTTSIGILIAACFGADAAAGGRTGPRDSVTQFPQEPTPGVVFEENAGQTDPRARFVARTADAIAFLTAEGAVVKSRRAAFALRFEGAAASLRGAHTLGSRSTYLIGTRPSVTAGHFASVRAEEVAPGIDVVWRGGGAALRFDVEVAPGADPSAFRLVADGAKLSRSASVAGAVEVAAGDETRTLTAPVAWQVRDGRRSAVDVAWRAEDDGGFSFRVAAYDPSLPLVIDPTLTTATYLGGAADDATQCRSVLDPSGDVIVAGTTFSTDFPAVSGYTPYQAQQKDQSTSISDGFVARFSPDGRTLIWRTYLGGTGNDAVNDVAVTSTGEICLGGSTSATDFPASSGAIATSGSGFVSLLGADGKRVVASTYLSRVVRRVGVGPTDDIYAMYEGTPATIVRAAANLRSTVWTDSYPLVLGPAVPRGLFVDSAGNAWVAGYTPDTTSANTTGGVYQRNYGGGANDALFWRCDALDGAHNVATFLGGTGDDRGEDIAIDGAGAVVVCGRTTSTSGFPTTGGFQTTNRGSGDAFVAKLNAPASTLIFSSFLGGTALDVPKALAIGPANDIYVAGDTDSTTSFPLTGAIQSTHGGGTTDAFLVKVASNGALRYGTYHGGNGADAAGDVLCGAEGRPMFMGRTASTNLATTSAIQTSNAGSGDVFLARVEESTSPFTDISKATFAEEATVTTTFTATQSLPVDGGNAPFTYLLARGALPSGVTLSSAGILSGVPAAGSARDHTFGVAVTDADGAAVLREYVFRVNALPTVPTTTLAPWTTGEAYTGAFTTTGGTAPFAWSLVSDTSAIPPGTFVLGTGELSGTPTAAGSYTFQVDARDIRGATARGTASIVVNPRPVVTAHTFAACTEGADFSYTFGATLGTPPYSWLAGAGTSPVVGSLNATTGKLSGKLASDGDYTFEIRVRDLAGAVEGRTFNMRVNQAASVVETRLPPAVAGRPYRTMLNHRDGTGAVVWTLSGGTYPAGFTFDATGGGLSGLAGLPRAFAPVIRLTDSCGVETDNPVTFEVVDLLSLDAKKNAFSASFGPEATEPVRRALELTGGTKLSATMSLAGKGELGATLSLEDGRGAPVDIGAYLRVRGTKATLKNFPVAATGRYVLVVTPAPEFAGTVNLTAVARAQSAFAGTVNLDPDADPVETVEVTVPCVHGATLDLSIAAAKKSPALATILSVTNAAGDDLIEDILPKFTKNGAKVTLRGVPAGDLRVRFAARGAPGTAGACNWTAKLRLPRTYDVELFDLPAGE